MCEYEEKHLRHEMTVYLKLDVNVLRFSNALNEVSHQIFKQYLPSIKILNSLTSLLFHRLEFAMLYWF